MRAVTPYRDKQLNTIGYRLLSKRHRVTRMTGGHQVRRAEVTSDSPLDRGQMPAYPSAPSGGIGNHATPAATDAQWPSSDTCLGRELTPGYRGATS
jgi:hypothetical protein